MLKRGDHFGLGMIMRCPPLVQPGGMAASQHIGDVDDISEGSWRIQQDRLAVMIFGRKDDFLGQTQCVEQRHANALVPMNDHVLDGVGTTTKFVVLGCAVEHVERTQVVN